MARPHEAEPLTPAVLQILLALAGGELHGYAIMKVVEADSGGKVKMGPGTLYGSLNRMLQAGFVAQTEERPDPDKADIRRRYYRLTALGESALRQELSRLQRLVTLPASQKLLGGKA